MLHSINSSIIYFVKGALHIEDMLYLNLIFLKIYKQYRYLCKIDKSRKIVRIMITILRLFVVSLVGWSVIKTSSPYISSLSSLFSNIASQPTAIASIAATVSTNFYFYIIFISRFLIIKSAMEIQSLLCLLLVDFDICDYWLFLEVLAYKLYSEIFCSLWSSSISLIISCSVINIESWVCNYNSSYWLRLTEENGKLTSIIILIIHPHYQICFD